MAADNDARAHSVQLFTDEQRVEIERQAAGLQGDKITVENVAAEADRHWVGKLPGMGGKGEIKSWRGFYAIVYRSYSGFTHPPTVALIRWSSTLPPPGSGFSSSRPTRAAAPTGWRP